ncbi:L-threonylcarbamoyladenylate synthase [Pontixanthobacter aestiaquae]|uniref:Threonylcarbamoyl-AMP synthase n=1 Tax=Pontixanthobacter aestiaquae TaxID=1509367 RepID=A0A844Z877_9SPHN|nr:L-threonylcarbamoyladenylate synthase [Pontixanthobacter aestiaquae]MDN3646909.1 L-threonylcarbamoyladenylate synthase [Pontixanthobacter aestiaquae]MXO82109.1 threonylcarbamoyl-AMP synthase [Pontixanthobacter aestiaquae]
MSDKDATETTGADAAGIARAAEILRSGGLVAVPTETVYGLAARADSEEAVAKIYAAKGRPSINPLIVHIASLEQARSLAEFVGHAEEVAAAAWPGALTLVLPRKADAGLASAVSAGLPTIAIRMPAHPTMRALIEASGFPLAAPSANRSNAISPTSAEHVLATLEGRVDLVLDGGTAEKGLESTILAIRHDGSWEELRPGPVDVSLLHQHFFDRPLRPTKAKNGIEAPGQMQRHYSPGKPVRLNAREAASGEFLIGFGAIAGQCSLSESGDLGEAAARLYACLHQAAEAEQPNIAIAPIPDEGVGKAVNDRLRRAAA